MEDKITVRLPFELRRAIGRFRSEQQGSFKSTQAACRHISEEWLTDQGYLLGQQTEQSVGLESLRDVP